MTLLEICLDAREHMPAVFGAREDNLERDKASPLFRWPSSGPAFTIRETLA